VTKDLKYLSQVGVVLSVRIIRDLENESALAHAYVNYDFDADPYAGACPVVFSFLLLDGSLYVVHVTTKRTCGGFSPTLPLLLLVPPRC
jgi:hypothetical protein